MIFFSRFFSAKELAKPVEPIVVERPIIFADQIAVLSAQEKAHLRNLLNDPIFVKMMNIAEAKKPPCAGGLMGSKDRDQFSDSRSNTRLAEIRGWELHKTAMFAALIAEPPPRAHLEETFPDEKPTPPGKTGGKKRQ